jgi:prepilin-type N-terminal cleavage/methylation domain-containing protein
MTGAHPRPRNRGFTLVEMLVTLVVVGVVGAVLVRFILANSRIATQQDAWRGARSVARRGLEAVIADFRSAEVSSALASAAARDITVRSPYAFGVICRATGALTTISLLPPDSVRYATGGFSGFAWRDDTGNYNYVEGGTTLGTGTSATCLTDSVTTLTGGKVVTLSPGAPVSAVPGTPIFLFRRVRYEFKASVAFTGRQALWRTSIPTGATAEIAAPFDTSARFRFFVLNRDTAQDAVPSPLSDTRGIEVLLNGASLRTPYGATVPKVARATTAVFFQNRIR